MRSIWNADNAYFFLPQKPQEMASFGQAGQQKAAQARGRIDKFNKKYGLGENK